MNNNSMNNKKKIPTDGITSDIDLYNLANKIKIKLNGIYFKNELPSPHLGNYIINLASSNDNSGGTHWVHCELRNENNIRKAVYFDPFGLPEATLVTKFLLKWITKATRLPLRWPAPRKMFLSASAKCQNGGAKIMKEAVQRSTMNL